MPRDACLWRPSTSHAAERLLPLVLSMLGLRCRFDIDLTDEQFKELGDKVGLKNVGGQARILWAGVMCVPRFVLGRRCLCAEWGVCCRRHYTQEEDDY